MRRETRERRPELHKISQRAQSCQVSAETLLIGKRNVMS